MSDEILTGMGKVPGVQIVGRNGAYRYKNRSDLDIRTVARELGVRFLMTGAVREGDGKVMISAQLNDSVSRGELWSDTFTRDSKDFGSIADPAEALEQLERARTVERVSPLLSAWTSYAFFLLGRVDSALAESARPMQLDSTLLPATNIAALIGLARGRPGMARRASAVPRSAATMTNAPYVYAKLGDTATANHMLRAMEANDPRPWFTDVAQATVLLGTGDSAGALGALERAARTTGGQGPEFLPLLDPAWDPVPQSPRFAAVLSEANLDVRSFTRPRGEPRQ